MPQKAGRYPLLHRLASGGMASLYLSRIAGPDGFVKLVAVKVIHEHLTQDRNFVEMFVNEARLASRISHPNVAQIIELGKVGKTHFIAMEYVNGESVGALLKQTRPTMTYCARIVADAAAGLHAAHQTRDPHGELLFLVHRDVSPQNILISYDGTVKLVDFGVARAQGSLHTTEAGKVKGKFAYMAPEQLTKGKQVDHRADVFALGIVLYEMTTHRRLFTGDTEADVVAEVLQAEIEPPSKQDKKYPELLEAILMRALEREPEVRFQTALELQEALERFIVESGDLVMPTQVGEMMSRVFAEQVHKKKELLRECETGDIESLEQEIAAGSPPTDSAISAVPSPRSSRRRWALVLGGIAAVGILSAVALVMSSNSNGGGTTAINVNGAGGASPAVDTGQATASGNHTDAARAKETISISLSAAPGRAMIRLDGKKVSNPYRVRQPAADGVVEAVISAAGYHSRKLEISLARGGAWAVTLKPKPRRRPRRQSGKGKKPSEMRDDDVYRNPYGKKRKRNR